MANRALFSAIKYSKHFHNHLNKDFRSVLLANRILGAVAPSSVNSVQTKLFHLDSICLNASHPDTPIGKTMQTIDNLLEKKPDVVASVKGVYQFNIKDSDDQGSWYLDLKNGAGGCGKGDPPNGEADCTMGMTSENFVKLFDGKLNPTQAFMTGKLKISGNLGFAMKLEKLMKQMREMQQN